jgi:transcriptional regulator with XRE-family HTH domain
MAVTPTEPNSPPETPLLYDFRVLRRLRKRAGLTIEEVSARSGVSTAVISRLERNQSVGELETLYRLARVFAMSATDLLSLAESPLAQQTTERRYAHDSFSFRRVRFANTSCFHAQAKAGARVSNPEIHREEHELCWVLRGCVRLVLPGQSTLLRAGDCLQFDAILEHSYEALEDSELILVHTKKDKRYGS